ncbi:MAG: AAA family ATPase [Parcubacteria group bacterium]|jgi:ATP-dependent Clp protease ATP-binding subunit ClpC
MNFFFWHYSKGTKKFFEIWRNYLAFFWWYFGVSRMLLTLFSPWKRDISRVGERGLHPILFLQSAFENLITRFLGAIVRLFTAIFGLIAVLLVLVFGVIILVIWLLLPFVLIVSIVLAVAYYSKTLYLSATAGVFLAVSAILFIISIKAFFHSKEDEGADSFKQYLKKEWFKRVWNRIGVEKDDPGILFIEKTGPTSDNLKRYEVTAEEFQKIIAWESERENKRLLKKRFWSRENLFAKRPIGADWTFAYTVNLDKYSSDLSKGDFTDYKDDDEKGRYQDIEMLELILTRPSQNSILLIGEAGTGKMSLAHHLAKRIREHRIYSAVGTKRVLVLNIGEVVSGVTHQQEIEQILRKVFFEATYAGNIILVIENIDRYLKKDPKNAGENISAVLSEFLAYPNFQIIGLSTPENYHGDIESHEQVLKYFEKVQIEEMSAKETLDVLFRKLEELEKDGVIFTYQALREIVRSCEKYISDSPFPEKALDLLEEVLLYWSHISNEKYILPETVDEVVSKKYKIPVGEITEGEKDRLIDMEKVLHQRVIGQEFAIKQIAETIRRARTGMANANKPLGSFLFLGPTGVGKTESAKALAEAYFGDEKRMIRLDMSEFQRQESINRLLGSPESGFSGQLTNKVKENPYSLLLLDEVEKAHPDILSLFLQVLDEGWLTDAFGKKISFKNEIIIATSNAASDIIKAAIEKDTEPDKVREEVINYVIEKGIFKPEFLNRFEGVIFFSPLTQAEIIEVAKHLLIKYAENLKNVENIDVIFNPEFPKFIVEKGYDKKFGARSIDRFIQDRIGDRIVKKIISGEIQKGSRLALNIRDVLD